MVKLCIPEQIKKIRKEKGMTQLELALKLNVGTTTVSEWEKGTNTPRVDKLQELSEVFNVPISFFFTDTHIVDYVEKVVLPIYGEVSCGNGMAIFETTEEYQELPKEWTEGGNHFFLRARGDSMTGANIHEGDLLLVREQPIVENGEIAVVIINNQIQLKRVYRNNSTFTLVSENPEYPTKEYNPNIDNHIRIVGKLKKSITTF